MNKNCYQIHSVAISDLDKSKETTPTTTTSLKLASQRAIFHKNGNPLIQTSVHKIFNRSLFRLPIFFLLKKVIRNFFCPFSFLCSEK